MTDKCHQNAVILVQALRNTSVAVLAEAAAVALAEFQRGTMNERTYQVTMAQLKYLGHRP